MQKLCCVRTRQQFSASLDYFFPSSPPYLHQFSTISGGNCITTTVKLTLLQTAVRNINDLRIVETLDEFQSTTYGHGSSTSLSYETYYDLLINACVRYDKTEKANIGKRRNVYTKNIDDTYVDHPTACIDHVPNSSYGGIDLPPDEFCQVHTLSSRHPPSPRPGNPSRPSF